VICRQGFKQEDDMKGFRGKEPTNIPPRMKFCRMEVTILNRSLKWQGNRQKGHLVQDLAQKHNNKQNHHK
jgi:hypothetical protein